MKRLLFAAIIFLCSCTSLNKVESTHETNTLSNEYTYSDPDSQIRYDIMNDSKNLHIRLNTANPIAITKILRSGLKICFDLKGKKSNKFFFEYPLPQSQQFSGHDRTRSAGGQQTGEAGQQARFDLNRMIEQIPNEAEFDRDGVKERVVLMATDSDIKASFRAIRNNEITFDLIIPLKRISQNGIGALSNLSLGFIAGKDEESSSQAGRSSGGGGGGRSGGMGGGGRSGGGGRGGMGGGGGRSGGMGGGGERSGGMDRSSMSKPIEFWFKLSLIKVD